MKLLSDTLQRSNIVTSSSSANIKKVRLPKYNSKKHPEIGCFFFVIVVKKKDSLHQ